VGTPAREKTGGGRPPRSFASRVERPAFGTLDAFVDVNAFSTVLGKLVLQKGRKVVEIARAFSVPRRATDCFLVVGFGKPRMVAIEGAEYVDAHAFGF
jgi:hypothetical protein